MGCQPGNHQRHQNQYDTYSKQNSALVVRDSSYRLCYCMSTSYE